ncbi:YkgB family protein [Kordiimonas aestuarii]|uniref:YkgB family protein n=1 Tax=Kordiimonas aestuarii TaxID=1005925 RepID=UPI0021D1E6FF|nr:YkgB family protein [Kordiimonas aestuarii]
MFAITERVRPGRTFTDVFVTLSLAVLLIWFGLMNISGASTGTVERWISGHILLKGLLPNKHYIMWGLGGLQALAGLLIALHSVPDHLKRLAYWFVAIYSLGALSLMFTNPVWIESLGGFPAIGSGQGIIKHVTLLGLAMWRLGYRYSETVMLLGLILVLGWIGCMKFTAPEANGVEPLLKSSPVFNWWLTNYFDKQGASNVIGVIELVTLLLLTGYWWNRKLFTFGCLLSAATFVVTLSFLVTFGLAWNSDMGGFPYLSSSGLFLLKDLPLLAATFVLARRS